jgi:hypothetical protein
LETWKRRRKERGEEYEECGKHGTRPILRKMRAVALVAWSSLSATWHRQSRLLPNLELGEVPPPYTCGTEPNSRRRLPTSDFLTKATTCTISSTPEGLWLRKQQGLIFESSCRLAGSHRVPFSLPTSEAGEHSRHMASVLPLARLLGGCQRCRTTSSLWTWKHALQLQQRSTA